MQIHLRGHNLFSLIRLSMALPTLLLVFEQVVAVVDGVEFLARG